MDLDYIRETFLSLVQTDSHSMQEGAVAKLCKAALTEFGFEVVEDNAGRTLGGQTGNLIATRKGDSARTPIMLAAHMDTVKPGEGVKPRIDDNGVVWSDGTTILGADDKAGVTAILAGLRELTESGHPTGDIQVVLTIGEEIGLQGAKHVDRSLLNAKLGLSLDSGGQPGTIVTAGPAQVKWQADITGVPAHAGVAPERGVSAIKVAAMAVSKMPHGRIDEETTVNIGSFIGDGPTNVVRDKVALIGEARSRNGEKLETLLEKIGEIFKETAAAHGASSNFEWHKAYDGFRFAEGDAIWKRVAASIESVGLAVRPVESGGGSDANLFTSYGIPTMNVGIGYEDIHSTNEHIALRDIADAASIVVAFCRQD